MESEKFVFKKSLGQNFLRDKNIINRIIDSVDIDKKTLIIEIGPGDGALTSVFVPLCGHAILFEADVRLESRLNVLLSSYSNYSLILGDFLQANIHDIVDNYSYDKLYVIANLPYYITTPILFKFINDGVLPDKMVIMVQKEVAARFAAKVGCKDYGSLTVLLNYYYDIHKLFDVSRNCFVPKPNVDSSVVCMSLKKERLFVFDIDFFKRLVRDSFTLKRKTIRNNLKNYDFNVICGVLEKYGFDSSVRAEQLELKVFVDLANELFSVK